MGLIEDVVVVTSNGDGVEVGWVETVEGLNSSPTKVIDVDGEASFAVVPLQLCARPTMPSAPHAINNVFGFRFTVSRIRSRVVCYAAEWFARKEQ